MLIDISDIIGSLGAHKIVSFQDKSHLDYVDSADVIKVDVKATNAGTRILVDGCLETKVKLNCSRCCEDFIFPVKVDIKEEFIKRSDPQISDLSPEEIDEANFFVYDNDTINISEAVRQNIITAISVNPVCEPACKGICTVCGKNKNFEKCECK